MQEIFALAVNPSTWSKSSGVICRILKAGGFMGFPITPIKSG
jgi:hypothetical protein